jgi:hypothetical protein
MFGFVRRDWIWLVIVALFIIAWRVDSARKAQQIDEAKAREDELTGHVIDLEIQTQGHKARADMLADKLRGLLDEIKPMP